MISGLLFIFILIQGHRGRATDVSEYQFSTAVHPPVALPAALNSLGLWFALMILLTVINYGFPIVELLNTGVSRFLAIYVGSQP